MSNCLSTIRFKTKNCGGIGGLEKKRRELFDNLRHNNDVIVLTETKFKQSKEDTYRQEWNSGMYNSCTTEDRAQAGVSILFGRDLDITILEKDHGLRGLGAPNSAHNRRQRGRKAPGAG